MEDEGDTADEHKNEVEVVGLDDTNTIQLCLSQLGLMLLQYEHEVLDELHRRAEVKELIQYSLQ